MTVTLYDQLDSWATSALNINGDAALTAVVDEFYKAAIADQRLSRFFEGADLESLKRHQFNFMRYTFSEGRSGNYTGRKIGDAHSRLIRDFGLNEEQFDYVAEDLVAVLNRFEVPQAIIDGVVAAISPLRELFMQAQLHSPETT
ncbi:MAG: group I truncated hemoglobin [Cyanobacteriota bacterium]|jgi:hemoglobin